METNLRLILWIGINHICSEKGSNIVFLRLKTTIPELVSSSDNKV